MIYPPPIWTPPVPTLILPGRTAERVAASSKRMLLVRPDFGFRPSPPAIVQTAKTRTAAAATFPGAVTVGALLIAAASRRSSTGGLQAAIAPTDGEAWTTLRTEQSPPKEGTSECGLAMWGCIATSAAAARTWDAGGLSPQVNRTMWQISGASLAGITTFGASDQGASMVEDLGSLGVLSAYRLAFGIWANNADNQVQTITPGVWNRSFLSDRDQDSDTTGFGNTVTDGGYPVAWSGYTQGAGIAVQARVDTSASKGWGAIVVLLA